MIRVNLSSKNSVHNRLRRTIKPGGFLHDRPWLILAALLFGITSIIGVVTALIMIPVAWPAQLLWNDWIAAMLGLPQLSFLQMLGLMWYFLVPCLGVCFGIGVTKILLDVL